MTDDERWEIKEVFPGSSIFQMQPAGSEKTLIQKFAAKKVNKEAAAKLTSTLDSIRKQGMARSIEKRTIKRLSGNIVEIRVPETVIRGVSFNVNGNEELVLLSIERTHKGSGNMSRIIKDVKPKAQAAETLLEKKKGVGNG